MSTCVVKTQKVCRTAKNVCKRVKKKYKRCVVKTRNVWIRWSSRRSWRPRPRSWAWSSSSPRTWSSRTSSRPTPRPRCLLLGRARAFSLQSLACLSRIISTWVLPRRRLSVCVCVLVSVRMRVRVRVISREREWEWGPRSWAWSWCSPETGSSRTSWPATQVCCFFVHQNILGDIWLWIGVPWASSALEEPLPESSLSHTKCF